MAVCSLVCKFGPNPCTTQPSSLGIEVQVSEGLNIKPAVYCGVETDPSGFDFILDKSTSPPRTIKAAVCSNVCACAAVIKKQQAARLKNALLMCLFSVSKW